MGRPSAIKKAMALGLTLYILITWLGPGEVSEPVIAAARAPSALIGPGVQLIKSDEESVVLELYTPQYRLEEVVDGVTYHLLSVADCGQTAEVGKPQLPLKGVMLGVPPAADFSLRVLESESLTMPGRYNIYPVPRPVIEEDLERGPRYVGLEFFRDEGTYSLDAFYPADIAQIGSSGFIRSQRFVQLRLYPFQYNPVSRKLKHYRRIRVELSFGYEAGRLAYPAGRVEETGPFDQILKKAILNYETARNWQVRPRPVAPRAITPAQAGPSYKISVNEDGIYRLTYTDLQNAGLNVGAVAPSTFKLHNQGVEVAIYVAGQGDGSFDPSDHILFYGQKMKTKYTETNVYWLTAGGAEGSRMPEKDGSLSGTAAVPASFQTTVHLEENHKYQPSVPSGEDKDHWFWNDILAYGSPASASYTTTLQNLVTSPFSGTLRGLLQGFSYFAADPDHHTRTYLNGYLIDDGYWDERAEYLFEALVPGSYLIEGTNTISVECPVDIPDPEVAYDIVYINWFEINYHRTYIVENDVLFFDGDEAGAWQYQVSGFITDTIGVFDVTDPISVSRIISTTVIALSHKSYLPLVMKGYAPSSGLDHMAVSPADIHILKFEDSIAAERRYLALTPARWKSPLSIVEDIPSDLHSTSNEADYIIITHPDFQSEVLPLKDYRVAQGLRVTVIDVQDIYDEFSFGVFDPRAIRDFLAYAYANWAPPAPSHVLLVGDGNYDFLDNSGWGGPYYIPPYLAYVDPWAGEVAADNRYVCVSGDDILADIYIGRLPVQTSTQASAAVNKILNYEGNPPAGDWNHKVLFVADDFDPDAGDFAALSNDLVDNYLPSSLTAQKVYHPTASGVKVAIIDAINEGRLLVNYIGHASIQFWGDFDEHFLDLEDIASLTNDRKQPVMLPMTCLDGYFIHPTLAGMDLSCLGESIVRAAGKGAVASWSPTGLGVALGHDYLDEGFFTAVFTDGLSQLGPATWAGKLNLYNNAGGGYRDLIDTYILFGDPAMELQLPPTLLFIGKSDFPDPVAPGGLLTYTINVAETGGVDATGVQVTDTVPANTTCCASISQGGSLVGNDVDWSGLTISKGQSISLTFAVTVGQVPSGTIITNDAYRVVTSTQGVTTSLGSAVTTTVEVP